MKERRLNPRMLCADLVKIDWRDRSGVVRTTVANLEDISASGACLQIEEEIPLQTLVTIGHDHGEFQGRVRYCIFKEIGFFLGIEFDPGFRWTSRQYKPMHLLDPRRLSGIGGDAASQSAVPKSQASAKSPSDKPTISATR